MTDLELAYYAGLFDGEGCIQISHDKPAKGKRTEQHTLTCRVSMTNKDAVEGFLMFGGSVCIKRASKHNPKWKDQFVWAVSSNIAVSFLKTIYPYLRLKQPEANLGIEFQTLRAASPYGKQWGRSPIPIEEIQRREWYRNEMKRLKDSRFPERRRNDKG